MPVGLERVGLEEAQEGRGGPRARPAAVMDHVERSCEVEARDLDHALVDLVVDPLARLPRARSDAVDHAANESSVAS
jgi:hypothetical protein